jgi:hypothetical protein
MSKIEVDAVEPQSGTSLTLGASGDTITIPAGATFDSSAATTTLPATVVTTTGTQTLSNKTIDATQLTGTVATSNLGTGTADATTFLRGDQTYAAAGGTNTPAFSAYANTDQNNLTDNTWVKLQMNAEFYDTDSKYDITNYRFTPTIAGTYMFGASVYVDGNDTRDTTEIAFYKNGTKLFYASQSVDNDTKQQLTAVIELDTDDYVELYAYADVANDSVWAMNMDGTTSNNRCYWYGYKLIT